MRLRFWAWPFFVMKILITDIDSTLSVGEYVAPEVREALRHLRRFGWEIMVATGRTLRSSLSHISQIGAGDIAIVYDGARCMRSDGTEICSFKMSSDDVAAILDFTWGIDVEIQVACDEHVYCRHTDVETINFCNCTGIKCSLIKKRKISETVYRVAFWGTREKIFILEKLLCAKFGERFSVIRGGDFFLDVLAKNVSKGAMLGELIARQIIPQPRLIVAAGDHMNDFELLKRADIVAVPRDGALGILEIADIIIPSAKENGIKFLVEHLTKDTRRGKI